MSIGGPFNPIRGSFSLLSGSISSKVCKQTAKMSNQFGGFDMASRPGGYKKSFLGNGSQKMKEIIKKSGSTNNMMQQADITNIGASPSDPRSMMSY